MTTVPPEVWSVAKATGLALPAALVSLVIALAVAVPLDAAPNAVALRGSVATAVPGAATVDGLIRKTRLPLVLISAVTASVAALRAAVEWVTAILKLLQLVFIEKTDKFVLLDLAGVFAFDFNGEAKFTYAALQCDHELDLLQESRYRYATRSAQINDQSTVHWTRDKLSFAEGVNAVLFRSTQEHFDQRSRGCARIIDGVHPP
jgi:hypothetical protein